MRSCGRRSASPVDGGGARPTSSLVRMVGYDNDRARDPSATSWRSESLSRIAVMSWVATTSGITGDMVRDRMVEVVEARFGGASQEPPIEWLTDNGSQYIARDTRSFFHAPSDWDR